MHVLQHIHSITIPRHHACLAQAHVNLSSSLCTSFDKWQYHNLFVIRVSAAL